MTRAAVYARYSATRQQPTSIDDQFRLCRDLGARAGYELVGLYSDVATTTERTNYDGLNKLIADAAMERFDVVISESVDCILADNTIMKRIFERLRIKKLAINTVSEGNINEIDISMRLAFKYIR